jgi:hypothetical protein
MASGRQGIFKILIDLIEELHGLYACKSATCPGILAGGFGAHRPQGRCPTRPLKRCEVVS